MAKTQLVTRRPDGTQPRWLGASGHVTKLVYSSTFFGGFDSLTAVLELPANYRSEALNPGRQLQGYRGGEKVWDGTLDEPSVDASGWTITGTGLGHQGDNFDAIYTTWTNQNDAINQAITRGLRWVNPGVPGSVWLGQQVDSGSQSITDLVNLFCLQGNLGWSVDRYGVLSVSTLPTSPTRTLICTTPVSRTLAGYYNTLYIRYASDVDKLVPSTFATTVATNQSSINKHGALEGFLDLSSAGQMTTAAAQAVGNSILSRYIAANFSNAFTLRHGELVKPGGQPVDLGTEMAGRMTNAILTDYGYGGELTPDPIKFIIGRFEYDDMAEIATVTPFLSLRNDFAGILGEVSTVRGYAGEGFGGTAHGEFLESIHDRRMHGKPPRNKHKHWGKHHHHRRRHRRHRSG